MDAAYLQTKHKAGVPYAEYLATGTAQQRENWQRIYDAVALTDGQKQLLGAFTRRINVIGLSGIWCGDCAQQCPLIQRIAEASDCIDLRWLDRDQHLDLQDQLTINGGKRVPVMVFCAEDHEQVGWYGDRTLCRYRRMADQQLGGACPLPGAPVPADELAESLQCWINEFERVHLLLRLSTRLRQKHGD